jgi:hypothetical protein
MQGQNVALQYFLPSTVAVPAILYSILVYFTGSIVIVRGRMLGSAG